MFTLVVLVLSRTLKCTYKRTHIKLCLNVKDVDLRSIIHITTLLASECNFFQTFVVECHFAKSGYVLAL